MRISSPKTNRRGQLAFTLTEMMVATTTFVLVMGSVIACNLYGLSMAARQQMWLGASGDSANALGTLMDNIRSASSLAVGSYTNGVFTPVASTATPAGNALLLTNITATTTNMTLYYYDMVITNTGETNYLMQSNYSSSGVAGNCSMVSANAITNDANHPLFTEVDYTGATLPTALPIASINIYLSFTSLQNAQVVIEAGSLVDLFQINATVTPRMRL